MACASSMRAKRKTSSYAGRTLTDISCMFEARAEGIVTGVQLTVHRATQQIGGNCIELSTSDGHRIILDVGRPLDAPQDAPGLLAKSLDITSPVDGLLISHPHQDHYGLLDDTPSSWPVYCGEA